MKRPPDMSRKAFTAALKRRGWRQCLLWIEVENGVSIGMLMQGGKIKRRASLAHAIAESERIARDRANYGGTHEPKENGL